MDQVLADVGSQWPAARRRSGPEVEPTTINAWWSDVRREPRMHWLTVSHGICLQKRRREPDYVECRAKVEVETG